MQGKIKKKKKKHKKTLKDQDAEVKMFSYFF